MTCLSLEEIDISMHPLPPILENVSISMRGSKNILNIYFSLTDVESIFGLPTQFDFQWIHTPSGKQKYITYPTLKSMLFQIKNENNLVVPYLSWINEMIYLDRYQEDQCYNFDFDDDTCSSMSDNSDCSLDDNSDYPLGDNGYVITALQHKIQQLEHQLELQKKDNEILKRDNEILRIQQHIASDWV